MKSKFILFVTALMLISITVGCTIPLVHYDVDIPFLEKSGCQYCSSLEGITLPRYDGDDLFGDLDNDGVMNVYDCCWTVPTNWLGVVFGTGCVDSDFDTIADTWDACPSVPGEPGSLEDPLGCPRTTVPTTPATPTAPTTPTAPATNAPPVADFTYTVVVDTVYVSGALSTDDVNVTAYIWNFGDGAVGAGESASHGYSSTGTKYVTLTVVDGGGLSSTAIKQIEIQNTVSGGSTNPNAPNGNSKWFGFLVLVVIIGGYIFLKLNKKNKFIKTGRSKKKVALPSVGGTNEPIVVHTYTRKPPERRRGLI